MRALLALLLMVVALGVASAQERTDAPASIPLPEVASRAERVMADLRQLDALLVRPPEVEAIERELPPVVVRLRERSEETTLGLAAGALPARAGAPRAARGRGRGPGGGALLAGDAPRIWSPELRARALARVPVRVRDVVGADAAELADFLASRPWRLAVQLAGLVALGLALRRGQARARRWMAQEESVVSVAAVFDHPFASALLLAALASWWMYPGHPRLMGLVVPLLVVPPVLVVSRHIVPAPVRPALYALGSFYVADRLRDFAAVVPLLERTLFLLEAAPGRDRGTRAGRLDRHGDRRVARRSTRCRGAARPGPRAGAREPPGRPGAGAPGGDAGEPAAVRRDGVGGVPLVVFPSVHSRRGRVSQAAARPRPAVCGLGHPPLCDALRRLPLRRDDPRRRPHPRHDPGRRVGRRRRLRPAGHRQQLRLGADPLDRAAAQDRRFHPVRRPRRTGDAHRYALEHGAHVGGSRGHRAERDAGRRAGDQLDALRSDAPHRSARRRRLRHAPRAGARAAHAGGAGPRRRGGRASAAGALPRLRRQRAQVRAARVDGALRGLAADPERAGRRGLRGAERGEDRDPVPAAGRPHQARRSGRALSGHRLTSGPTATRVCPDDPGREQPQSPSPRGLFESSVTHGYRSASARV